MERFGIWFVEVWIAKLRCCFKYQILHTYIFGVFRLQLDIVVLCVGSSNVIIGACGLELQTRGVTTNRLYFGTAQPDAKSMLLELT